MLKPIFSLILAFVFAINVNAQTSKGITTGSNGLPPLIDIELFFGDPDISGAQISPDGKYISFRKAYKGIMNIWVKDVNAEFESAKPITADTKRPVRQYFWSRDSKYILYAQDFGGDENYRIYSVDPSAVPEAETGVPIAKDLTPIEKITAYILSVPKKDPENILIGLNDRDPKYHDAYRLNIRTGERTLLYKNESKVASYIADLDGNIRLAAKTNDAGGQELYSLNGNEMKMIYSVNSEESFGIEGFLKDTKYAYLSTNKGNIDLTELQLINIETGETSFVESDPEKEVDFGGMFISEVTRKPIMTFYQGDKTRIYIQNKEWEKSIKELGKAIPPGEINIGSMTDNEEIIIVYVNSDIDPGSAYLFDRNTGEAKLLYRSRPSLKSENLAEMTPIKYTARDGMKIPGYIMLPKGIDAKNLPTVIFPHGGPWARDGWGYSPFAQFLANRGYAVLIPNFRGSTGYGKKFLNAGNKEWGTGAMQHDLSDGVKYMIEQGIADPKRVAIMGGSYGGYATLAGLAFTPEIYAAGVDIVGPSNLFTLLKTIPPYWESFRKIMDKRLGSIDIPEDVEKLKKQSPLFSADKIKAPLLVIQGANDPRVNKAEADQIVSTLRDMKRNVEYILAMDEGHGFAGKLNRLAMIARIDQFLSKFLGGRAQEKYSAEISTRLNELTVDINTVKVIKADDSEIEKAKSSPMPEFKIPALKPAVLNYTINMKVMGQEMNMKGMRTIKSSADGKFEASDEATLPMGTYTDAYTLDAKTLLPLTRIIKQGAAEVLNIVFTNDNVKGKLSGMGKPVDINTTLTAPVLGEGLSTELAMCLLPLKQGYNTYLRFYDYNTQTVKYIRIDVNETEELKTAMGNVLCYEVYSKDLEANSTDTYWISVSDTPMLIKSEVKLPASMGGGTSVAELVSVN